MLIQADYEARESHLTTYVFGAQKLIDWIERDIDTFRYGVLGPQTIATSAGFFVTLRSDI